MKRPNSEACWQCFLIVIVGLMGLVVLSLPTLIEWASKTP